MNLADVLDAIWESNLPRKQAAQEALGRLDEQAANMVTLVVEFVRGQVTSDTLESEISSIATSENKRDMQKAIEIDPRSINIVAALQFLRDHTHSAAFKPNEERRAWLSNVKTEFELSEAEFARLLTAVSVLEESGAIRDASRN